MDNYITLTLLVVSHVYLALSSDPVVKTPYGKIKGLTEEFNSKEFTAFYGIPYAAAPVGELRFRPPQRHEGWGDSVLDALEHGAACPQMPGMEFSDPVFPKRFFEGVEDEDCLFLNIFVPGDISDSTDDPLPVIVFIHGGGFVIGASVFEIGDAFVTVAEPVVMVAIQYRTGILGFLTSGDEEITGNMGLKDQTFALKWVQENIAAFGGDPNRVTICGESAGGESVLAHMISPMSAGLFTKASAQSAPPAWIYPSKQSVSHHFQSFIESMDCGGNTPDAVKCLRAKPWQAIANATSDVLVQRVIDGEFITDEPRKLWARGEYNDAELMYGFTADDGRAFIDVWFAAGMDFQTNRSQDSQILALLIDLGLTFQLGDDKSYLNLTATQRYGKLLSNKDDLFTVIKARYVDSEETPNEKARGLLDLPRDQFFVIFGLMAANEVAKGNINVYVYCFEHPTEILELNKDPDAVRYSAPHAAELPYQFGYGLTDSDTIKMSRDEISLTHSVIHAWTSFASGKPSYLTMDGEEIDWPKFTLEEPNVLYFDTDMSADSVRDGQKWNEILDFWLAIDALADWEDIADTTDEKAEKEEL